MGDEGWFAPVTIPSAWAAAGPGDNGLQNYLVPGPGLGTAVPDDDREVLLDEVESLPLKLFANAPVPQSSSEPFDIEPPLSYPDPVFTEAK
ncbi:MAG: hypothetical protein JW965_00410 [Bacteroidales bacterium]|nr:hypothetical protein [Bacteroidales bacterium]